MADRDMMRALVFDGPWSLSVQQRPAPEPRPGEVIIRILATGICGSDLHGFTGENGRRLPGQVMGHESVGEVVSVGVDTARTALGEIVTFNPVIGCGVCAACRRGETHHCRDRRVIGVDPTRSAAMAELVSVPAANVVPLSPGTPPELGALVEPLSVGWHAARRGAVDSHTSVLIQGAGAIGQAAALAARRAGSTKITVSEPNPARRQTAARLAFDTVDPTHLTDTSHDVVIDAVGTSETVNTGLAHMAEGGRLVLVGMHSPRLDVDAYAVSTQERTIIGSYCYSPHDFATTAAWVGEQGETLLPLIEGRVDLDHAPAAFAELVNGTRQASKVLIMMQRDEADA